MSLRLSIVFAILGAILSSGLSSAPHAPFTPPVGRPGGPSLNPATDLPGDGPAAVESGAPGAATQTPGRRAAPTTYYVSGSGGLVAGDDANDGTSAATPWLTLARVKAHHRASGSGALRVAGDVLYLQGTFREPLSLKSPGSGCTIAQWPGGTQTIVRGDTIVPAPGWTYEGTAGVFYRDLAVGTVDSVNNRTLPEGIASVIVDWDTVVDYRGRHSGHLERAQSLEHCRAVADTYWFDPTANGTLTAGENQDGRGRLTIHLNEGYTAGSDPGFVAKTIAYCLGNKNGVEIGTNRYADNHYTQEFDPDSVVTNMVMDGIWSYLWPDSGWRSQYAGGGLGIDVGATNVFVNSMGYAIRPADWVGGIVRNIKTIDGGYHGLMFVGQRNANNTFQDSEIWGGMGNMTSGGSASGFYCSNWGSGSKYIIGCRARRVTTYKYTLLGRSTETVDGRTYAIPIGFPFFDSAAVPITVTAATATNPTLLTLSSAMPVGYTTPNNTFWIKLTGRTGGLEAAAAIAYPARVVDPTHITIPCSAPATGTAALAVFPTYDGFISHTNATPGNRVLDIEYADCTTYESGCESLGALCTGSAFKGGELGPVVLPADGTDARTYPVRFVRCKLYNAAYNVTDSTLSLAFVNCTFQLDRHGAVGSLGAFGSSGALGSGSGAHYILYDGCEIRDTMGNADPSLTRNGFQTSWTNRLFLKNVSYYGVGKASNPKHIFNFLDGSAGSYVFARGSIFGFKPDIGGPHHLLIMGVAPDASTLNQTNFDMEDCFYFGITEPHRYPGPSDFAAWFSGWQGVGIDQNGIDNGPTSPFADTTGASLGLTALVRKVQKQLAIHTNHGVNGPGYSGHYGAYQYGCPSDYNNDGFVDGIDYDQFSNDFENPDPAQQMNADFNLDGFVDGIDYDQFMIAWSQGC